MIRRYVRFVLNGRDDNQQMRDVGDFVHQIRGDSLQAFVGELARWEDVNDIRSILTARISDVDDSGCLLLLKIVDEADLEVFGLS